MSIRHEYRKAKRFKLDENFEVNDEFTGNDKNPVIIPNSRWGYRHRGGSVYHLYGNSFRRFLQANLGRPVNNVFSDFCRRQNGSLKKDPNIKKEFWDTVIRAVEIDGNLYNPDYTYHKIRFSANTLSSGDFYMHPKTGLLCQIPKKNRERWGRYFWRPKTVEGPYRDNNDQYIVKKEVDGMSFFQIDVKFNRKIGCGIFETESQKVWYKQVSYQEIDIEYDMIYHPEQKKYECVNHRPVWKTKYKSIQASKKDIRKYKLNEI